MFNIHFYWVDGHEIVISGFPTYEAAEQYASASANNRSPGSDGYDILNEFDTDDDDDYCDEYEPDPIGEY